MAGAMRFSTVVLGALEAKDRIAADRAPPHRARPLSTHMAERVCGRSAAFASCAEALAAIDVTAAAADRPQPRTGRGTGRRQPRHSGCGRTPKRWFEAATVGLGHPLQSPNVRDLSGTAPGESCS
jgi:hypothetical protein